ncbi:MAG: hypothetical protein RSD62_05060 [Ruthenibacterium sp.]
MDYGWLNLGSIVLGLLAFAAPLISIALVVNDRWAAGLICPHIGLFSALLSLLFQILYQLHLTDIQDWGAMLDTSGALRFVAIGFTAAVFLLYFAFLLFLCIYFRKKQRGSTAP